MGWSCGAVAGTVMNSFRTNVAEGSSNVWTHKGQRFMLENSRREYADGRITGAIYRFCLPDGTPDPTGTHAARVGSFCVKDDGTVRAGYGLRDQFTVSAAEANAKVYGVVQ